MILESIHVPEIRKCSRLSKEEIVLGVVKQCPTTQLPGLRKISPELRNLAQCEKRIGNTQLVPPLLTGLRKCVQPFLRAINFPSVEVSERSVDFLNARGSPSGNDRQGDRERKKERKESRLHCLAND